MISSSVGFTYLSERESSSNMYVEPFTAGVWWSCLAIGCSLALAQRVSSRSQEEKDGSFYAVLATWLQQGTDLMPEKNKIPFNFYPSSHAEVIKRSSAVC